MKLTWSDHDPAETQEWELAFKSLVQASGKDRAHFILQKMMEVASDLGLQVPLSTAFSMQNSIDAELEPEYPGDESLEANIESWIRWNAIVMVLRAKKVAGGVGGHLSSFASICTLYEVGMNHFFRGRTNDQLGDLIFFQGHSSEGNYARAFLEGRLTLSQLEHFRQEVKGDGLSSYPHPFLMKDFWQFATVSLGLGMLQGVYQARFLKYLENRNLQKTSHRKVWVFCGDGEMDEPESIAGLALAAREKLDNLIFVVNCNLQRLDGLVRSNYSVVKELSQLFKGAGWRVIQVLWDSHWDELFEKDKQGLLIQRLSECVDGDLQTASVRGVNYFKEFLFNTPELKALIADWSDEKIAMLGRGAHDRRKIFSAYQEATKHQGQPVVILALGIKGYGLGSAAEGKNIAHNQLDMTEAELKAFREKFNLPLTDEQLLGLEYFSPEKNHPALQYLQERRAMLGGYLPARVVHEKAEAMPELDAFSAIFHGSQDRTMSTTMVLGRILNILLKDKNIASRIVPIFSDEVRTFGMEALFRQIGIYSPVGQQYIPEDKEQFLFYHETQQGQVLEEGITEAGCMASWLAAATSYSVHDLPMIPIFTYYSMFGFQRVGDLIWAAGDMRARGFLIGATAGRTTLEGEGLQHQDGTSLLVASTFPHCRAYDPAFGYEMAVIIQHGLKAMYEEHQDVVYYLTAMNERYIQPAMPEHCKAEDIIRGMYLFQVAEEKNLPRVQLLGSGAILNEVIAAAHLLKTEFGVSADVFSVTSFSELARQAKAIARDNMRSAHKNPSIPYVTACLDQGDVPVIAATDYVRAYSDLIRPFVNAPYITLGTDGFGRSDTRQTLREFFEVDSKSIVLAALYALRQQGKVTEKLFSQALKKLNVDANKPHPWTV